MEIDLWESSLQTMGEQVRRPYGKHVIMTEEDKQCCAANREDSCGSTVTYSNCLNTCWVIIGGKD